MEDIQIILDKYKRIETEIKLAEAENRSPSIIF